MMFDKPPDNRAFKITFVSAPHFMYVSELFIDNEVWIGKTISKPAMIQCWISYMCEERRGNNK